MSDKGIPDLSSKLNAPKKTSQFEKQRQEAEAKRLREEAENRAALREFQDSFAEDEDDDDPIAAIAAGRGGFGGARAGDAGGYVRGAPMRNSGPGTLGPVSAPPPPPPPSMKRKRELDMQREQDARGRSDRPSADVATVKRPTMLLTSLPRTTTEDNVRQWLPKSLKIDDMVMTNVPGVRCSKTAVVALSSDTASSDIDSAVNVLHNRYLGFGFYLNMSKHITISNHVSSAIPPANLGPHLYHFGAKPMAVPPHMRPWLGSFVPVVHVSPPSDLKQLLIVNKTVEKLIKLGPGFEPLLMSLPHVQQAEHFAFLYDHTSPASIWYRWLVWKYASNQPRDEKDTQDNTPYEWTMLDEFAAENGLVRMTDEGPLWRPPMDRPKFEHVTNLEDLVNHPDYESSDLDTDDEDEKALQAPTSDHLHKPRYLNPYRKAKLTFYLQQLPESTTGLCLKHVQAVTDLVIKFAPVGAEEVVDLLMRNLEHPFCYSVIYEPPSHLNKDEEMNDASEEDDEEEYDPEVDGPSAHFSMMGGPLIEQPEGPPVDADKTMLDANDSSTPQANDEKTQATSSAIKDMAAAQLVGLYVISDALAATSVSGVRDAWKYRALFESALTQRHTFQTLGRMPKQQGWGRVRSEQWKSRIVIVLDLWERESIFSRESHERFKHVFLNPPLTSEEAKIREEAEKREREEELKKRWKSGDGGSTATGTPEQIVSKENTPQPVPSQQDPKRRSRPTAADLISATAEGEAPPPKPAPKLGNFSMSLNAPSTAAAPSISAQDAKTESKPAVTMGFSLGGGGGGGSSSGGSKTSLSVGANQESRQERTKQEHLGIFGDSDSE